MTPNFALPRPSLDRRSRAAPWLLLVLVVPVALFLGLLPVFLPWFIFIPAIVVPLFFAATWWRPEYAIALLVLVVGGFLPDFLLPSIPIGGGTLRAQDMFLVFIGAICLLKHGFEPKAWSPGLRPFAAPLLALGVLVVFNVAYSRFIKGNPSPGIVEELRPFVFWTLPLWIVMVVNSPQVLRRFVVALMLAACVLALAQIAQATTGVQVIHGSRLESATVGSQSFEDVLRSTVPGIYLIILALLLVTARFLLRRQGLWLTFTLVGLFVAALLFTFGRALWGATVRGMLVVGLTLGVGRLLKVGAMMALVVIIALTGVATFKPQTAETMVERALSVADEGGSRTSLGWRFEENRYAWARIKGAPILGLGLGGAYKPMVFQRGWEGESRFVHNANVAIPLKLGFLGAGIFVWLFWRYMAEAVRLRRRLGADDPDRAMLVALGTILPMMLVTANIRPEWVDAGSVCVLSLGLGLMAALRNVLPPVPASPVGKVRKAVRPWQ